MTDEEYEDARDLAALMLAGRGLTRERLEAMLNGVHWCELPEGEKIEVIRRAMQ